MKDNFSKALLEATEKFYSNTSNEENTLNLIKAINIEMEAKGYKPFPIQQDSIIYTIINEIGKDILKLQRSFPDTLNYIYNNINLIDNVKTISTSTNSLRSSLIKLPFIDDCNLVNEVAGELKVIIKKNRELTDLDKSELAETLYLNMCAGSVAFTKPLGFGNDDILIYNPNNGNPAVLTKWGYTRKRYFNVSITYWNRAEETQILNIVEILIDTFKQLIDEKYTNKIGKDIYWQDLTSITNIITGIQYLDFEFQEVDSNGTFIGDPLTSNDIINLGIKKGVIILADIDQLIEFKNINTVEGSYDE